MATKAKCPMCRAEVKIDYNHCELCCDIVERQYALWYMTLSILWIIVILVFNKRATFLKTYSQSIKDGES